MCVALYQKSCHGLLATVQRGWPPGARDQGIYVLTGTISNKYIYKMSSDKSLPY
jgi:hypothetical protein